MKSADSISELRRAFVEKNIADLYNVITFLNEGDEDWKDKWEKAISNREKEEVLYNSGLIRTERVAAAKHSPIYENLTPADIEWKEILLANQFAAVYEISGYRKNYAYSMPYALSFSNSYKMKLSQANLDEKYAPLFLSEAQLNESDQIKTGNAAFRRFREDVFADDPQSLLWIPLVKCTNWGGVLKDSAKRWFSQIIE